MTNQTPEPKKTNSEGFITFVREHKWESAAYLLLFCGLVLSIFWPVVGGLLVGLIFGLSFSQQIRDRLADFKQFIDEEGIFRGFIILAAFLVLLLLAFGLCVGTALGTFLRPYLPDA